MDSDSLKKIVYVSMDAHAAPLFLYLAIRLSKH